eukprot:TRINITY_DN3969_c0_g1_i1.p1 TRINITY_DN3969_c0_g1~~TRINITY_DN3969_c0_g1_i1.p1  ORF type:complete len:183 (+),score=16.31 TRINITY_DN3969_c0_g1_i1:383-931(+)
MFFHIAAVVLVLCFLGGGVTLIVVGVELSEEVEAQNIKTQCTIVDVIVDSCTYRTRKKLGKGYTNARGKKVKYRVEAEDVCEGEEMPHPGQPCKNPKSLRKYSNGTTISCYVDYKCSSATGYVENPYTTLIIFGALMLGVTVLCCCPVVVALLCTCERRKTKIPDTKVAQVTVGASAAGPPF